MQTVNAVLWLVCSGEGTDVPEPFDVQWERRVKTESVSIERSADGWCQWFRSQGQSRKVRVRTYYPRLPNSTSGVA